jgi:hypothetical protein
MPLKVIAQDGATHPIHSPQDFERVFHVRYLPHLECTNAKVQRKIEKRCVKALAKEWISPHQKWLGAYYAEGIRGKVYLDLTVRWIDDDVGYGVWTNRDIPAQTYIGEYTGMLRKRHFFGRWKNLYCFDYNIGEARESGYVIDALDFGNHTRFLNHSNKPNLEPASVFCDGMLHVIVYAKESVPAGAQLCYDYGEDYWLKRGKPRIF